MPPCKPSTSRRARQLAIWLLICVYLRLFTLDSQAVAQIFDDRLVPASRHDPKLTLPPYQVLFMDNLRAAWFSALGDDDPEVRRLAADTITRAHQSGMQGLEDGIQELLKLLDRRDNDRITRRAVARALVELDAEEAASQFVALLPEADLDFPQVVEPALANWDYRPMRDHWLHRLNDPAVSRGRLLLAIECLGVVRETAATDELLTRAMNPEEPLTLRLSTARAVGRIQTTGLVMKAESLFRNQHVGDRLTAAALMAHHTNQEAIALLLEMANDESPVVAGSAFRTLLEIEPELLYNLAPGAIERRDVNIRRIGASALVHRADVESVRLLGPLLNDQNRTLRRFVSDQFIEFGASDELSIAVIDQVLSAVHAEQWRGLEQALFVLGSMDHEPSASRMIELLRHQRPEVAFTAAWALRRISVAETLPEMFDFAKDWAEPLLTAQVPHAGVELQLAELFQSFGLQNFSEADPVMRTFIAKRPGAGRARAAAIWALGKLHKEQAPEDLTQLLEERLSDDNPLMPENALVRQMSAISLGRMRSEAALPTLKRYAEVDNGGVKLATMWAVHHLTGEDDFSPLQPATTVLSDWFLVPLGDSKLTIRTPSNSK